MLRDTGKEGWLLYECPKLSPYRNTRHAMVPGTYLEKLFVRRFDEQIPNAKPAQ